MRTVRTKVFKFHELDEKAQDEAIRHFYYINVTHDWWDTIYGDAESAGLKISEFDIYRRHIAGKLTMNHTEAAEKITAEHGHDCETYKTAKRFLNALEALTAPYSNIADVPEDKIEELEEEFKEELLQDYLQMLANEYDYQTDNEQIIASIEANEYEFYKSGKQFVGV